MGHTRTRLVGLLVAVWIVVPVLLAVLRWPDYWEWIAPERTPMTWAQSVVLMLAGAGCLLTALVAGRAGERAGIWSLLGAGLLALGTDERFAFHESLGDDLFGSDGDSVPFLPWVAPGDFLLFVLAAVGLLLLVWVWWAVRADGAATVALAVGVVLSAGAVGMELIDSSTWSTAADRVHGSVQEVVELAGGLALLAMVALRLLGMLDAHLPGAEEEGE
ncbi:hypothetical protein [Nocardiopsis sp. LOL_012]|uniref:hypothetical protein n=1 Tax=Nocardiopsis sp. LOL_012 TaxID=3345409 RepID=UPI003A8A1762